MQTKLFHVQCHIRFHTCCGHNRFYVWIESFTVFFLFCPFLFKYSVVIIFDVIPLVTGEYKIGFLTRKKLEEIVYLHY